MMPWKETNSWYYPGPVTVSRSLWLCDTDNVTHGMWRQLLATTQKNLPPATMSYFAKTVKLSMSSVMSDTAEEKAHETGRQKMAALRALQKIQLKLS